MLSLAILATPASAQQVLLAPLGSHLPPTAAVPVYAGVTTATAGRSADLGQSDPNPLSIPPELSRPVSLAPDADTSAAAPAMIAAPISEPSRNIAAPDSTVSRGSPLAQMPALPPLPDLPAPTRVPSRPQVVVQNRRLPTVEPGDAPYFPPVPDSPQAVAPAAQYVRRVHIPEGARYPGIGGYLTTSNGEIEPVQAAAAQQDAPLLPRSQSNGVFAQNESGSSFVPYNATSGAIVTARRRANADDPFTQSIDTSISSLERSLAPSIRVEGDYLGHNGQSGINKLSGYSLPIEAMFSPSGTGQLKLTLTPTFITANQLPNAGLNVQSFGQMGFGLSVPYVDKTAPYTYHGSTYKGKFPGPLQGYGTGVNLAYTLDYFALDVGTTPLGFQENNIVGGIMVAPLITDSTRVRLAVDRRAVSETVISYAGATDPYSGRRWGGVVRTGGRLSLESTLGHWRTSFGGSGGSYTGTNVNDNTSYDVFGRATYPVFQAGREELRTGVEVHYTSFNVNQGFYTYGYGGYFSPQRNIVVMAPIEYKLQYSRVLAIAIDGGVGYQEFNAKAGPIYLSSALQAKLNAITNIPYLINEYTPTKGAGITGNIAGKIDYIVSPNFSVGAKASFTNAGIYQSYGVGLYGRYVFNNWNTN